MAPYSKEFLKSPEGRARLRENNLRYAHSKRGRANRTAYRLAPENRETLKAQQKRYATSAHGKARKQITRKEWRLLPRQRFKDYRGQCAKARGLVFELAFEEFMKFWQVPCAYCGTPILTIGLDRIDNSVGYIFSNLRACCLRCNQMKRDDTVELFLNRCRQIVARIGPIS